MFLCDNDYHARFIRLKLFIFKGVVWNSLLVMFLCENNYHVRFIRLFYFFLSVYGTRDNHVLGCNDVHARFILHRAKNQDIRTKNQDQMGLNNRYYLILSGYLIRLIISLWQLIPVLLNHDPERVS